MSELTQEQQERMRLFISALRSGKYRQTNLFLTRYFPELKRRKHCCLGVACEVAMLAGLELKVTRDDFGKTRYDRGDVELPIAVQQFYGFLGGDPALDLGDGRLISATRANDIRGMKFSEIADAFERTYLSEKA